jgi:hypothetical protein
VVIRAALVAALAVAPMHAIHSTYTHATFDRASLTLEIRAFADDFSAAVARFAGRTVPRDSSAPAGDVARYVASRFTVASAEGGPLALVPCGFRRERDASVLCFRATLPMHATVVRVRNLMLTELHADQVNVVRVSGGAEQRTMLFTASSGADRPIRR